MAALLKHPATSKAMNIADTSKGGAKLILHLSSSGSPREGRSVGPFLDGRKGRSGSETGSEISEIVITPMISDPRNLSEAGRSGSVGRTDPGRNRARAAERVGRSGTINVKSTSHPQDTRA